MYRQSTQKELELEDDLNLTNAELNNCKTKCDRLWKRLLQFGSKQVDLESRLNQEKNKNMALEAENNKLRAKISELRQRNQGWPMPDLYATDVPSLGSPGSSTSTEMEVYRGPM